MVKLYAAIDQDIKASCHRAGFAFADVPEQVMTVLRLTNLDRVLRAHATVVDASHDW